MKKRILALLLCLGMALTLLPVSAMAAETIGYLTVEDGDVFRFIYSIASRSNAVLGILKISPHMTLPSYSYDGATATEFGGITNDADRDELESLVISPTIEIIGDYALNDADNLEEVTMYEGRESALREIGLGAFEKCGSLTDVELPDTLRILGPRAFFNCAFLESITLPEGLESIGYEAFALCPKLKSITIPASVTEIEDAAFGVDNVNIYPYKYDPEFIVYGQKGSYAQTWATRKGCRFVPLGGTDYERFDGTGVVSIDNFANMPHRQYTPGMFRDVDENVWYGANKQKTLQTAFELGIMSGKGEGLLDPNGPVQITEALKMAAVVYSIYTGGRGQFVQDAAKWWKVYADYCIENGIITANDFDGHYFHAASRAEMAYIFANTLPYSELKVINDVKELPDVTAATPYYEDIMTMYRCGALQGNDDYGTFTPDADITRAAAAAIIARIALPEQRLNFTLKPVAPTPADGSYEPGMWVYDLETLGELYTQRLWGLYPDMRVHMSDELVSELRADPNIYNEWAPMAVNVEAVYNENDDDLMVYAFKDYSLSFELDALMKDESVSARATASAKGYLEKMDSILASLALPGKSERDSLLAIHDWMVANTAYDLDYAEASYQFYGPLDTGKAVCNGYAELFYYLATRSGTTCYTVTGFASSGPGAEDWAGHAWNMVQLKEDNSVYFIDVTYDDPVPDTTTGRHTYFMVTAEALMADHLW